MLIFQNLIHNLLNHPQNHQSTQNHLHPCLPLTFGLDSRISIYNLNHSVITDGFWAYPVSAYAIAGALMTLLLT